jgi:hypothetical protein
MSVRDVEAIDYIGINILFKRVYVGIFDELDWQDDATHRDLLTRKIDRCIRYIRSGQLLVNYPKVRGYEIAVEYVSMHPMTQAGLDFWTTRETIIRLAGFAVRTRGVDVRPALGIEVETLVEPEPTAQAALVEPAPLRIENLEVLNAERRAQVTDIAAVSYLPPPLATPRNRHNLPVLTRLSTRRTAAH